MGLTSPGEGLEGSLGEAQEGSTKDQRRGWLFPASPSAARNDMSGGGYGDLS
jgi:hypothetical protein